MKSEQLRIKTVLVFSHYLGLKPLIKIQKILYSNIWKFNVTAWNGGKLFYTNVEKYLLWIIWRYHYSFHDHSWIVLDVMIQFMITLRGPLELTELQLNCRLRNWLSRIVSRFKIIKLFKKHDSSEIYKHSHLTYKR